MSRVENVSGTKRIIIYTVFILFSVIFLGIIFAFTTEYSTEQTDDLNYSTWLVIAYLAGLSMIVLPCTLPFVFIIVPMTIDKGYKKGLTIALLFGMGMTVTITLYGLALALLGKTAGLNNISEILMLLAGTISFLFGLHRLQLINIKLPSYSGTPKFMLGRGDYSKAGLMGLLVGNAGVGCTNPLFYIMLIYIMGTGSPEIGTSLGFVHGIGRAIPLILVAVLAMIGFNPARKLVTKRTKIEKMSGFLMIILGSFLIINGIPEGQQWYMDTFFHSTWNEFVEVANLPEQFSVQVLPEEFVTGTGQPSLPPSSMEEMQHEDMENLEPDKMNVLTTKNDWNLYFWWEPREELQVNNDIIFNIMFFEPQTQTMTKKNITYDLEVYQNNILLESRTNIQNTAGHDMQQFKFSKEGGAVVKIKNINGVDTEGEFSLEVSTKIEHTTHNQNKFQPRFPLEFVPVFTGLLIVFPIIWYTVKNKKKELEI